MKKPKLSLNLNKEVITQLNNAEASNVMGGDDITSIIGSNCYNTNPVQHNCCTGTVDTVGAACNSQGTVQLTALPGSCCC